jgi:hypothetical protein
MSAVVTGVMSDGRVGSDGHAPPPVVRAARSAVAREARTPPAVMNARATACGEGCAQRSRARGAHITVCHPRTHHRL